MTDPDFVWLFEDEPGQHNVEDAHAVHEVERNIDEELTPSYRFKDLFDDVSNEHDDRHEDMRGYGVGDTSKMLSQSAGPNPEQTLEAVQKWRDAMQESTQHRFEDLLDDVPDEHDDRLDGNPVRGE